MVLCSYIPLIIRALRALQINKDLQIHKIVVLNLISEIYDITQGVDWKQRKQKQQKTNNL